MKVDRIDVEKLVTHPDKICDGIWFSGEVRAVLVVIDRGQRFTKERVLASVLKTGDDICPFLVSRCVAI